MDTKKSTPRLGYTVPRGARELGVPYGVLRRAIRKGARARTPKRLAICACNPYFTGTIGIAPSAGG